MSPARPRRPWWAALGAVGFVVSGAWAAPPEPVPAARAAPVRPRPVRSHSPKKATAPVDLELLTLKGGLPGEETTVLLWAEPAQVAGRLDLELKVPEGVRLISGSTAESAPVDGGTRLIQVVLELPSTGPVQLIGLARWFLPGGQVWTRAVTLDLPAGTSAAPKATLPLTRLPGGGFRVDLPSGGTP